MSRRSSSRRRRAFELLDITPPESGYIPLLGSFLFVTGVAYYLIRRGDLARNRDRHFTVAVNVASSTIGRIGMRD